MKLIELRRFKQEQAMCAIAASACIANYYNKEINYETTKITAKEVIKEKKLNEGFYTAEIGILLNYLGFKQVTIISSDLELYDYSFNKKTKKALLKTLKEMGKNEDFAGRDTADSLISFLKNKKKKVYNNKIIVDYEFGKYIRQNLDKNIPLMLSYNWTLFFKFPKTDENDCADCIVGESEYHIVVACGYDKKGVYVVDSHQDYYKYKLKKYKSGRYLISWETLMIILADGDIIIPKKYNNAYRVLKGL